MRILGQLFMFRLTKLILNVFIVFQLYTVILIRPRFCRYIAFRCVERNRLFSTNSSWITLKGTMKRKIKSLI